MGCSSHLRSK
uniref:Uncharacterized protein n=1 Tax=Anguilla anguilla TaxID=7936 RepID=A0A0E9PDK7_ANGAN